MTDPTTNDKQALLPCPFCGPFTGESEIGALYDPLAVWVDDDDLLSVVCRECEAFGPKAKTQAEAIAAWNTRTIPNVDELLEAGRRLLEWWPEGSENGSAAKRYGEGGLGFADDLRAFRAALQQKDARG